MRQHSRFFRLLGSAVLATGIGWPGCGPGPAPGVPAIEPVFILSTELLAPPIVGLAKSYRPDYVLDIRPEDPSTGQAVGFVLTVAATRPESLRARLLDTQAGTKTELVKVDPPAVSGTVEAMTQLSALARASAELRDHRWLSVSIEPQIHYDIILTGKVEAQSAAGQEASARLEVDNLTINLSFTSGQKETLPTGP